MKNKTSLVILALALVACAFANPKQPDPVKENPSASLDKLQAELDAQKAQTTQQLTVAQQQIDILTMRAERAEYAFQASQLGQQNVALRNDIASANARAAELQTKANDMQIKYELEKDKVEALLKKHPEDGAVIAKMDAPKPAK